MPEGKSESVTQNVAQCQRCGGKHDDLPYEPLNNPIDLFNYWATCPKTKQPLLLHIWVVPNNETEVEDK